VAAVEAEGAAGVLVGARTVGEPLPLAEAQALLLLLSAGEALALEEPRALILRVTEPAAEVERAGEAVSRGERLGVREAAGDRLVEGDTEVEGLPPGERLLVAVALGEREPPGERETEPVAAGEEDVRGERETEPVAAAEVEARGEAEAGPAVALPAAVTDPEREGEAVARPLPLWEGLPLSVPREGEGALVGEPRGVAEPSSVRVEVGDGGGARVSVNTALTEAPREGEVASLAVAPDAEGEAVERVTEAGAVALTVRVARDAEGDSESAGVLDSLELTLGEALARSLAVAADAEGLPVG
jgi:hypothetical protein